MYPQSHFLFPLLLGGLLTRLGYFSWKLAVIAGIVGMLVDLDHLAEHIAHAKKNKWDLKRTWNESIKGHRWVLRSFIHHRDGELLMTGLFIILAFMSVPVTLALALGYYTHIVLDDIHVNKEKYYRFRMFGLYFREGWHELVFDTIMVAGILGLIII